MVVSFKDARLVGLLLAHPRINPNVKNQHGYTAVMMACAEGLTDIVRAMRVDLNVRTEGLGLTPLLLAVRGNHMDVLKWMVASGREIDFQAEVEDYSLGEMRNALGLAKKLKHWEIAQLLREFYTHQVRTRFALREILKFPGDGLMNRRPCSRPSPFYGCRIPPIVLSRNQAQLAVCLSGVLLRRVSPPEGVWFGSSGAVWSCGICGDAREGWGAYRFHFNY